MLKYEVVQIVLPGGMKPGMERTEVLHAKDAKDAQEMAWSNAEGATGEVFWRVKSVRLIGDDDAIGTMSDGELLARVKMEADFNEDAAGMFNADNGVDVAWWRANRQEIFAELERRARSRNAAVE